MTQLRIIFLFLCLIATAFSASSCSSNDDGSSTAIPTAPSDTPTNPTTRSPIGTTPPAEPTPRAFQGDESQELTAFDFTDQLHGWVTKGHEFYATMDGGQNWVLRGTLEFYVEQLQAVSSDEGWFSSGAFLFHTTDGGMTWTRKEFPNSVRISDMEFIDPEYGWVLAGKELFSTSDGGETWSVNTSPCLSSEAGPVVSFVNEAIGWIGCPSIPGAGSQLKALYRSDDSGGHWTLISNSGLPGGTIAPGHVPAGGYMHDVFFLDELNGWISTTRGGLIKTSDGGLSWTWVSVGEALSVGDEFVTSARFFSLDEGYALVSTHDGVLAHTDDAGATWSVTFPPDYSPLPQ